jgi:hypothetical protein
MTTVKYDLEFENNNRFQITLETDPQQKKYIKIAFIDIDDPDYDVDMNFYNNDTICEIVKVLNKLKKEL